MTDFSTLLSRLYATILEPVYLDWLWQGFKLTLSISLLTMLLATVLGSLLAGLRHSRIAVLHLPALTFCTFFRHTPLLVQLFFWYFAVGKLLPDGLLPWLNQPHQISLFSVTLSWPSFEFLAGTFGLTLYFSAFIAEEIRAGIRGVAGGQQQAALALGLTEWQSMRYVVLPQAWRIVLIPVLGQYMNIIKSSSLTMAIGVAELSYMSRQVETETLRAFAAFAVATLLYVLAIALLEAVGALYQHQRRLILR